MTASKYKPAFAEQARKLCDLGAIDDDLAGFFDVTVRTICQWRAQHKEFAEACRVGKDHADDNVERSLYQRATGASHPAQKVVVANGEPHVVDYIATYPPDTGAAVFWLKNRRGWRDVYDHRHGNTEAARLSDAELEALAAGSGAPAAAAPESPGKPH